MKAMDRNVAFTLVELLVVIAIIAVLASLLFPVLTAAKHRANETACISNLKQIGIATQLYAGDNSDYAPPYTNWEPYLALWEPGSGPLVPTNSSQPDLLFHALRPYLGSRDIVYCPLDRRARTSEYFGSIRHRATSYSFRPFDFEQLWAVGMWPVVLNLSSVEGSRSLWADVAQLTSGNFCESNHGNGRVNVGARDTSVRSISCKQSVGL